ncbi:MAG TPA: hypothetical protein DCM05_01310 [Elusimicrobia bacterium]|nr:hypothetical protein [Elusimicrobiota bacterium]
MPGLPRLGAALLLLLLAAPARAKAKPDLLKLLDMAPAEEKPVIVRAMGRQGKNRYFKPLLKLFDPRRGSPALNAAIAHALGDFGDRAAVGPLVDAWDYLLEAKFKLVTLPPPMQAFRVEVAAALAKFEEARVLAPLKRASIDDDPAVVQHGLAGLARLRQVDSVGGVVAMLSVPNENIVQAAYEALGEFKGDPRAEDALRSCLENCSVLKQVTAAYGLARLGRKVGSVKLDGWLEENYEVTREGLLAAYYLLKLRRKEGLDYLLKIVENEKSEFRAPAVQALGKAGDERAVPVLIARIPKEGREMRLLMTQALGRIGGKKAVAELRRLAMDPEESVRGAAKLGLAELGIYDFG